MECQEQRLKMVRTLVDAQEERRPCAFASLTDEHNTLSLLDASLVGGERSCEARAVVTEAADFKSIQLLAERVQALERCSCGPGEAVSHADFSSIVDRVVVCEASINAIMPGFDMLRDKIKELGAAVDCAKNASEVEQQSIGAELSRQFGAINVAIAALQAALPVGTDG